MSYLSFLLLFHLHLSPNQATQLSSFFCLESMLQSRSGQGQQEMGGLHGEAGCRAEFLLAGLHGQGHRLGSGQKGGVLPVESCCTNTWGIVTAVGEQKEKGICVSVILGWLDKNPISSPLQIQYRYFLSRSPELRKSSVSLWPALSSPWF